MCPNQLTATITGLAAVLAQGRTTEEISLLAAILVQLGDTLATIATQQALCESQKG